VPVAVFGGSYGGMLAAWIRIKYPHLVDAALAASAPILMVNGPHQDLTYFQVVTTDFAEIDAQCPVLIRNAFSEVISLAASGQAGLDQLTQQFSLCSPLPKSLANHLVLWVVNAFVSLAMCDYPYPTGFLAPLPAWPVKVACEMMLGKSEESANSPLLARLAQAAGLFYNGTTGTLACFNITDEYVECADQTGCGLNSDGQAWDYQSCSEVSYFPITNNVTDMFPPRNWDLPQLTSYCGTQWGIIPRPNWLVTEYGFDRIARSASNIIFSNGRLDPWHVGGVLTSLSDTLVAINIADGAHHLDLRESNPKDPDSVIVARKQEVALLQKWLGAAEVLRAAEQQL